jgi:hypothetical protein
MAYPTASFPAALDTVNQIGPGDANSQVPNPQGETHSGIHAQIAAILAAIETAIGITGSTDPTSILYKLRAATATVVPLADGAHIATDASQGTVFDVTIAGDRILDNPTNPSDGQVCTWRVKQGAGGNHLLTYGSAFNFGAAGAPTLSTTAAKIDEITARYNLATTKWDVVLVSLGF